MTQRTSKFTDLIGHSWGKLTVVRLVESTPGIGRIWLCRCECGNECEMPTRSITSEDRKSCGCSRRGNTSRRLPEGEAARRAVYHQVKANAKTRDINFEITEEEAYEVFAQNCFYCGAEPSQHKEARSYNGGFRYNGIDRYDNRLGYVTGNIVPCCVICNRAKNDMGVEKFLEWVARIFYEHY